MSTSAEIKEFLQDAERIVEKDPACLHCHQVWSKHADGKCLFEPTVYTPMSLLEHLRAACHCPIKLSCNACGGSGFVAGQRCVCGQAGEPP